MSGPASFPVLHYTGATDDRGGVMSVVHALATTGYFECVLGVREVGFAHHRVFAHDDHCANAAE